MASLKKEKQSSSGSAEEKISKRAARCVSGTSRTYDRECMFCQKIDKYVKGQNKKEKLVQCCGLQADENIQCAATKKNGQQNPGYCE